MGRGAFLPEKRSARPPFSEHMLLFGAAIPSHLFILAAYERRNAMKPIKIVLVGVLFFAVCVIPMACDKDKGEKFPEAPPDVPVAQTPVPRQPPPATKLAVKPETKPATKPKQGLIFNCDDCFWGEKVIVKDEPKREMFTRVENTFAVKIRVKVTFTFCWKEGGKNKIELLSPEEGPVTLEPGEKTKVSVKFKEPDGKYQCEAFAEVVAE